jgi:hypothetical protein
VVPSPVVASEGMRSKMSVVKTAWGPKKSLGRSARVVSLLLRGG